MGHYVTAYCSAHGEVDMDDSLAFCPDCYEVTPKGALTEARAEIERLKAWWSHAFKPGCASQGWELQCSMTAPDGLRHCGYAPELHPLDAQPLKVRDCEARIAELEADVVWAVENGAREVRNEHRGKPGCRVIALAFDESNSTVDCDGTPADILRAVREARNGVS